ncbi:MAG: hypothetical protein IJK45_02500 [Bacteroidaceae bacterium]|nr:hypothetical protein [Bacteroidaceae bacterium]
MGLLKDIKEEWTWAGFKKSMKEEWPIIIAVAIAALLTQPCLRWMGKTDSTLMFFLVQMVIFLLACVVIAMVLGIKRKIKK